MTAFELPASDEALCQPHHDVATRCRLLIAKPVRTSFCGAYLLTLGYGLNASSPAYGRLVWATVVAIGLVAGSLILPRSSRARRHRRLPGDAAVLAVSRRSR